MKLPTSEVFLLDCVEGMKRYADNYFDLAIVDPPYGIERFKAKDGGNSKKIKSFGDKDKNWNNIKPNDEYWNELLRVSKNQIIWGANYHNCFFDKCGALVWFKDVRVDNFSKAEIAYQSFTSIVDYFRFDWTNTDRYNLKIEKIHPSQKPVELYDFILTKYAKPNDLILDTHLGSGSSRIAAYKNGYDFTAFEIDKEYFEAQEKRFKTFIAQQRLF